MGKSRPCPHGAVKCANCGGPHGARADACMARRKAQVEARGWRSPSSKRREKGEEPEVPKERITDTQGEEEGEMEVTVPEGEGVVEMEE